MDPSRFAVEHVERRAAENGLTNVRAFVAPAERFPLPETVPAVCEMRRSVG